MTFTMKHCTIAEKLIKEQSMKKLLIFMLFLNMEPAHPNPIISPDQIFELFKKENKTDSLIELLSILAIE